LKKFRIAIPTRGEGGLDDVVSETFGRANTFTVVDSERGKIKKVNVLKNPAVSYKHGAGPIVVKMLLDAGVNTVIAAEFGPGVLSLLDQHSVSRATFQAGRSAKEAINIFLLEYAGVQNQAQPCSSA